MVFDLSTEDLGSGLMGELDDGGHAVDEHPGLDGFLVELRAVELDAGLLELLKRGSHYRTEIMNWLNLYFSESRVSIPRLFCQQTLDQIRVSDHHRQ